MADKMTFALVGVGGMGRANAQRVKADGRGRFVAVVDLDAKAARRYATELGVKAVYKDVGALLNSRTAFDAAIVSTTNVTHAPLSVALLEADKHVYCEKPPATNAAAARTVVAAEKASKGVFMYGFNQRFDGWAQYLKKRVEAGELGRIFHAQTQWHRRKWMGTFGRWFTDKAVAGGGPLIDIGVHRLDQTLWLLGFPKVISVSASTYDLLARDESRRIKKSYGVEDLAVALIKLEGGLSVGLQASYLSYLPLGASELSTLLMGTKCGYLQDNTGLRRMVNGPERPTDTLCGNYDLPGIPPMTHFIDCAFKGKRPMCTPEQGVVVMEILDAIYRSAESGREVVLTS